jgi:hypothetical protein
MSSSIDAASLVHTRKSLHAVAEHVMAGPLHRAIGKIGLRVTDGGFGSPPFKVNGAPTSISARGHLLIVDSGGRTHESPIFTIRAAAESAGVEPGGPEGVYPLETELELDHPLDVNEAAAQHIGAFFGVAQDALAQLVSAHADDDPSDSILWPEHFDVGISMSEVNYGGSPGDSGSDTPYLYVGPWAARVGDFWSEPFGAKLEWSPDVSAADVLAFFEEGRTRATSDPTA